MSPRCQSLGLDDKQCEETAVCVVRQRHPEGGIGWSGWYCKEHALRVVDTHWHHVENVNARGIEIVSIRTRRPWPMS